MTEDSDHPDSLQRVLESFTKHLKAQVFDRWAAWDPGNEKQHVREVVGGLLARQATLASEFALNPPIWNAHSAPLFLRPMVENCITISWILESPEDRAKQFIDYGLGQENLLLEHEREDLRASGVDPEKDETIMSRKRWLDAQKYPSLTEINVGSWPPNLRKMAEEVGLIDLHRQDYTRWSSATHNMWHHIARYNARYCRDPLHGNHRIPLIPKLDPSPEWVYYAAEYVDVALTQFDEATEYKTDKLSAVDMLYREIQRLPGQEENGADDDVSESTGNEEAPSDDNPSGAVVVD